MPEPLKATILIIAKEPMIAALMCSLVELSGHTAVVPRADEHPLASITRVRPAVLLLDCEHDIACGEAAYAGAEAQGARVLLFTPARSPDELERFAEERGLRSVALPVRLRDFSDALGRTLATPADARTPPSA